MPYSIYRYLQILHAGYSNASTYFICNFVVNQAKICDQCLCNQAQCILSQRLLANRTSSYGFHLVLGVGNIRWGPTFNGDHFGCKLTKILWHSMTSSITQSTWCLWLSRPHQFTSNFQFLEGDGIYLTWTQIIILNLHWQQNW
jgi:hypothetical protein